jgi:uncharacterized protein
MTDAGPSRVLILSDTHGAVAPAILELATHAGYIVHAGDIGSAAVLDSLATRAPTVAVRGNNDTPALWSRHESAVLRRLPLRAEFELPGGRIGIEHGDRCRLGRLRHADLRRRWPGCRAVVYGHSHRMLLDLDLEPWVLNPGAAGHTRTGGGASCLLLQAGVENWEVAAVRWSTTAEALLPLAAVSAWLAAPASA